MSKASLLRNSLLDLYEEHKRTGMLPTSHRFLFYEMVARGLVPKHSTGARRADQDVIDALTCLRERGLIPWQDIVDETRSLDDYEGASCVLEWTRSVLEQARIDAWAGNCPLILTESRSLAGVLRDLAWTYRVQIASTNGQCSGFLRNEIVPRVRPTKHLLYFGDLDFSGGHIEAHTRSIVESTGPLRWERLALTQEQVDEYGLTPIQKYDARDKKHHPAVETEALGQHVIADILRSRLDSLLPTPLNVLERREARQRKQVAALLSR